MVYMGSKSKYLKYIIPIMQKYIDENEISVFIDCFCGSANVADQINCETVIANDLSPTLIALHKQAQTDFSKLPENCSKEEWIEAREEWKKLKDDRTYVPTLPLYEIGAKEWYSSFSRGGFPKGYAKPTEKRNYYKEARRNHQRQAETENYQKIIFTNTDYRYIFNSIQDFYRFPSKQKILLYCDAPYKNTVPYGISKNFDFEEYYKSLREVSQIVPVFISEQEMPEDFCPPVWEKQVIRNMDPYKKHIGYEKLYFIGE